MSYWDSLSNFYNCELKAEDRVFPSCEQYYHYLKYIILNNESLAAKVLKAKTDFDSVAE